MPKAMTVKSAGVVDREERVVRTSSGDIPVVWSEDSSRWVSEPTLLIESLDNTFVEKSGSTGVDWSYLTTGGMWTLRALADAAEMWAAGFRLQDRASGRILPGASTMQVAPWFYQYDNSDFVEFANDVADVPWPPGSGQTIFSPPGGTERQTDHSTLGSFGQPYSANYGHGVILQKAASTDPVLVKTPWTDVALTQPTVDGTLSGIPAGVVKEFLYPTLYAKVFPVGPVGFLAMYRYEMRWVGVV